VRGHVAIGRPPRQAPQARYVKTSARFRTDLFRSLLRGLKAFRIEKIANNFALIDRVAGLSATVW
jgi:hypothetical protein